MASHGNVTARELRIAGEHAEGLEGEPLRLAYRDVASDEVGDGRRGIVIRRRDELLPGDVDLGIDVIPDGPSPTGSTMRSPREVTVDYGDGQVPLTEHFDALFWSPAAIEKFVLPYYLRLLPTADFEALRAAPYDPKVMAIGHTRPTIYAMNPGARVAPGDPTLHLLMRSSDAAAEQPHVIVSFSKYLHALRQQ